MTDKLELNVSRIFKCDAKTLFNAIGEGMLIKKTGSIPDKTSIDFKVGGKYTGAWETCEETSGEFLEINPHNKIVFTWNKRPKAENKFESKVTILLSEADGATTLHLKHEGLPGAAEYKSHSEGWLYTLKGMYDELASYFAKLESNTTGLDVAFDLSETIKAPIEKVFAAVKQDSQLQKYFDVKMSGPFQKGKSVTWDFADHPTFTLHVHEIIENEMIKFKWGNTHVVFYFSSPDKNTTTVRMHVTGFKPTQADLKSAFSECNGWTEFLSGLKNIVRQRHRRLGAKQNGVCEKFFLPHMPFLAQTISPVGPKTRLNSLMDLGFWLCSREIRLPLRAFRQQFRHWLLLEPRSLS